MGIVLMVIAFQMQAAGLKVLLPGLAGREQIKRDTHNNAHEIGDSECRPPAALQVDEVLPHLPDFVG